VEIWGLEKNRMKNKNLYTKRCVAFLIDSTLIGFVFIIPMFFVLTTFFSDAFFIPLMSVMSILAYILYWYILEKYYQATIGKRFMKLKVVDNGDGNYLIRSIYKFIPLNIISFLLTEDGRFWHDIYSHTNVVEINVK